MLSLTDRTLSFWTEQRKQGAVELSLDPSELANLSKEELEARYDASRSAAAGGQREDMSDIIAEESRKKGRGGAAGGGGGGGRDRRDKKGGEEKYKF